MLRRSLELTPLLLLVAACTQVKPVRGPDGTEWMAVSCANAMELCWKAAANECPAGYVVAQSAAGVSGYGGGEMLFRCKGDGETARQEENEEGRLSPESHASDLSTCRTAYAHFDELAAMRRSLHSDREAVPTPSSLQFLATCRDLPETAQLCLVPEYYRRHADACDATLLGLKKAQFARLDALFFVGDEPRNPAGSSEPRRAPVRPIDP